MADAVALSKEKLWEWKVTGCPEGDHPAAIAKRRASKGVRRVQRKHETIAQEKLYTDISNAKEGDPKTFHRLLSRRNGKGSEEIALMINGNLTKDPDIQRGGWADYYEGLATPAHNDHDSLVLDTIRCVNSSEVYIRKLELADLEKAIKKLNQSKAADLEGLAAEHFIYTSHTFKRTLTKTINSILQSLKIPHASKTGYKLPLPKKGKDLAVRLNYRGITITAILGKIIEHILIDLAGPSL